MVFKSLAKKTNAKGQLERIDTSSGFLKKRQRLKAGRKILVLNLARLLKVKPADVENYVLQDLALEVSKGTLIACKKGRFLAKDRKVFSPTDGFIDKIEKSTGKLFLIAKGKTKKIIKTEVALENQKKQSKESQGSESSGKIVTTGIYGYGKGNGEVFVFRKRVEIRDLGGNHSKMVVFVPSVVSPGVVFKADAIGVIGLIIGSTETSIIETYFRNSKSQTQLTLLVLSNEIDEDKIRLIQELEGQKICLDGDHKEVRAVK